ncbi:MAG TPA: BTAD domain-containing putative transcriptional regulator, partial [Rugosimonospora sp.]|nr:BTAD domain-containing putative transcriptional regulator [Rugosimonospora sp.]
MMRCTVRLMGQFEVRVEGVAVATDAWRSRRAADLVKLLALEPAQSMHREQVMALLWPNLAAEPAAANLRKAVHYARRALGDEDAIRSETGMLTLCDGQAEVDLTGFLAAADAALAGGDPAQCAAAADRYGGDPLPADRYEPWAAQARQRVRDRLLGLLKAAGQWQRVLDLDATDEQSHRELMRVHLQAGRRRDAMRQFERLREVLREHIGVGPDPQTIALYEQVLALEGAEPPAPEQRAAVLIATGLVHLNRQEFAAAERLARQAREIAVAAGLAHELGEAGTLLGLVASFTGRWYTVFRQEFTESLGQPRELSRATYEANLCFAEYHLAGAVPGPDPAEYARELLGLADAAGSDIGRGTALLMLGEAHLVAGAYADAGTTLRAASRANDDAAATSGLCLCLERLAQTATALGQLDRAAEFLDRAHPIADASPQRSHLLVRLFGVAIEAAPDPQSAAALLTRTEHTLADSSRVCEPCSMNFRVRAAITRAGTGDLVGAQRHLADAERIAGLWQGGPSTAAVWEARAA